MGHPSPAEQRALVRAAYLICLDRTVATRALEDELVTRPERDADEIRPLLYRRAVRSAPTRTRSLAAPRLPWDAERRRDDDGRGTRDALAATLETSDPPDRALVVAHVLDGLDPGAAATTLGGDVVALTQRLGSVLDRASRAHAQSRGELGLPPAPYAVAADLRDTLTSLADEAELSLPDASQVERRALRRARTRRAGLAVVGAGVTGLLALGVVTAWQARPAPSESAAPTVSASPSPTVTYDWSRLGSWPPRGSLASDRDLDRAVRAVVGRDFRIIYAERHAEVGRVAVVGIGSGFGVTEIQVFQDVRSNGSWELVTPGDAGVQSLAVPLKGTGGGTPGTAYVLFLAVEGEQRAYISHAPTVSPDGTFERTWQTVDLADGIGLTPMRSNSVSHAGFASGHVQQVWSFGDTYVLPDLSLPGESPSVRAVAVQLRDEILRNVNVDIASVRFEADPVVPLPADVVERLGVGLDPANPAEIVTVRATLPNGAVLRMSTFVTSEGVDPIPVQPLENVRAHGRGPLPPVLFDSGDSSTGLLLVDPTARSARIAGVQGTVRVKGGFAVLPFGKARPPDPLRVFVTDRDGREHGPYVPPNGDSPLYDVQLPAEVVGGG